jgi:hypothetical protein
VQVAGVISVGEHGNYPYTEDTKQHQYPRRRFFDAIAKTFERCGQVAPVFNDKHLAWNWADGKHIYDTARRMKVPLMAGSSVPLGWRDPPLELERGSEIEAAVAIGYGGLESYGFHAVEGLQCLIERRKGGETGVKGVTAVQGDALWQAERDGKWSRPLLEAALAAMPDKPQDKLEDKLRDTAAFYLVEHRDGLNTTVAMANGIAKHFAVALKLRGRPDPLAICFRMEEEAPYGHFAYLLHAIEEMIHTGKPSYPVERTLLATGVLDAAMHSLAEGGKRLATPELDMRYEAVDWPFADRLKLGAK